ncbi:hypothetical protein CTheo_6188 [Ceratobasidium theobromae]|uniref:Potassium channel tetramerisation-type BTB domain-containing protein n=1 Tax=Ceratobasidium theobromae TaxID=1582974 RepID=A0A5N5QGG2_9AGAM|nr:hypothetical protein CTheo_6188 [Ceratobasidium theobromae]
MPWEHDPIYTLVIGGTTFNLTQSQINFDRPNYFTACFLGDFHESQTRMVELYRSPEMFPLVIDYLCGYTVLPLGWSDTLQVKKLRAEAEFYQLEGLVQACNNCFPKPSKKRTKDFVMVGVRFDQDTNLNNMGKSDFLRPTRETYPFKSRSDSSGAFGHFCGLHNSQTVRQELS